jgi:uncharacterized membrane protein YdjX (TVP38/TMEM64 family)
VTIRTSTALRAVAALVVIAAAALFGRQAVSVLPAFSEWVKSLGAWGPAVFIGGYALAAVLLMPCFLLTLTAGALWGLRAGVLYVMLGASLGAIIAFLCARYLVRSLVQVYVDRHPRMAAVDRAVESEGLRLVFLLRLSPVVPYILLNYVLGVSRLRFRDYLGGLAGMLPIIAMYVYAGKVAGDLATLVSGNASPKGAAYYAMITFGLVTTIAASVLVARTAARSIAAKTKNEELRTKN